VRKDLGAIGHAAYFGGSVLHDAEQSPSLRSFIYFGNKINSADA
jgi:hypothetical protein